MTRLFKLAAGMGQPSSRYARLGQAHTGDLQKRRYTNLREIQQLMVDAGPAVVFERLARFGPELRTYLKPFAAQLCGAKTTLCTSEMIVRLVKTMLSGTQVSAAAQVRLEGEFLGIRGITGVPVVLSNVGVMRVEPLPLWPAEEEGVIRAARSSGQLIEEVSR